VNTTEPSLCDGDAALCQITLTARYYYYWNDWQIHTNDTQNDEASTELDTMI